MDDVPWPIILNSNRIRELRSLNILDTEPEQSYDDLAEIARLVCGTPVANVCLVSEDRQWFKAFVGSNVRETPVEQSVCAHALNEASALIINDLTHDERTRNNILVTGEASLRFYAGVSLRLDSHLGVGTLCVLDTRPHPDGLAPAQIEALEALGRQATILLQVRRFLAAQTEAELSSHSTGQPIENIADALILAYETNKVVKDQFLEKLLYSGLTHVAQRIARMKKSHKPSVN
ncbi:GAF domain-containing protein [Methylobacterium trifolii]|uniref:GAF domain-containing protein n=1 Tax=Methylobacterium trifolii TaxID=1003092 RepID=A0ABQ4U7Z7_9HYPH|nr:GAF domain-containing protein [Methylobacterium trifolii]GJE62513.1 hypothetical protein MPOCJGCO_4646 [Methylobacterium trifolii]